MFPNGGGSPDLFVTFFRIEAAQLKPGGRSLLKASVTGNVGLARVSKQLRQLFQSTSATTKEDI